MEKCKNCGVTFEGQFCSNCGQKSNSGTITFGELLLTFFNSVLDFEAPLYKTIYELTIKPGTLIRSYIRGKRKSYYNPIRYLIFTMALYLLIKLLIDFDPITTFNAMAGTRVPASSPSVTAPSLDAGEFFSRNINILIFILSFVLAGVAKLLYWKSNARLAEYMVLGFYSVGHYMLFGSLIIMLTLITPKLYLLNYLVVLGYFPFVLITFHTQGHWIWKTLKAIVTVIVSYILFAFFGFAISGFIVNTF